MSIRSVGFATFRRTGAAIVLGTLLALGACSTDEVNKPSLSGPSELSLALGLAASPDVLTADGASTAAVQAVVHDQNGNPKAGQPMTFALMDSSGTFADIGELNRTTAVTGPDGTATVIYTAPFRTDFTANGTIQVAARPLGTDARSAIYRTVAIELRSAEGRLFPPKKDNSLPKCGIVIQAPFGFKTGQSILFQTSSFDSDGTIVRYFWTFGDDSESEDKPDVNHQYKVAGSYTVTHIVTDNNGGQDTCTVAVTITD
jgi:PKD repeat protein